MMLINLEELIEGARVSIHEPQGQVYATLALAASVSEAAERIEKALDRNTAALKQIGVDASLLSRGRR